MGNTKKKSVVVVHGPQEALENCSDLKTRKILNKLNAILIKIECR